MSIDAVLLSQYVKVSHAQSGDWFLMYNAVGFRLRTLIDGGVERLLYVYDFGDDWRHDVFIEEIRDRKADIDYPAFVAGERRCPPEDVRRRPGFMRFLEAALNPFHDEHEQMLTWYGKPFDHDSASARCPPSPARTPGHCPRGRGADSPGSG